MNSTNIAIPNPNHSDVVSFLTNHTARPQLQGPTWTFIPSFLVIIAILAIFTNGSTLLAFLRNRTLWTPFNVYLANLTFTNLLHAILQKPPDIVNYLYPTWPLSRSYCNFYNYATYVLSAAMCNSHVLITIDRIWAVMSPIHYRNTRSLRTSFLFCATMWVYIHTFILPGYLRNVMYYGLPLETRKCYLNPAPQPIFGILVQMVIFNLALVVSAAALPLIFWKKRQRAKISILHVTGSSVNKESTTGRMQAASDQSSTMEQRARPARTSKGFKVLTLLTLSLIICWTPLMTYYTMLSWVRLSGTVFPQIATIMFAAESVLDPIWFIITMKDLREAVISIYLCRQKR